MSAVRLAALVAAVLACPSAFAAGAHARERSDVLLAQLPQPTAQPDLPRLTKDPPTPLGEGGDDSGDGGEEASPGGGALADTGGDAGLLGLAGASLLGIGLSLRLRLRDAA